MLVEVLAWRSLHCSEDESVPATQGEATERAIIQCLCLGEEDDSATKDRKSSEDQRESQENPKKPMAIGSITKRPLAKSLILY